jgi:dihydrolipoamide dehydrogenase
MSCGKQGTRSIARSRDERLVGAAAITLAGEPLAHLLALAINRGPTAAEMLAAAFYHPTLAELVQGALEDIVAQPKPCAAQPTSSCRNTLRRIGNSGASASRPVRPMLRSR